MLLPQRRLFGVPLSLWILAVIVLALVPRTESITGAEKQAIKKGLQTGKEILGLLADHKFKDTLKKLATGAKGFLGALGPFIGLVMTFVPSEDSAELAFMKLMMKEIDNHFDRVDSRFNEVERLIKWTETAVKFGEIESALNALQEEYRLFYNSSAPAENRKKLFIKSYDDNYKLAGTRLYQALISKQGLFNENLGHAVMRYTKNDRKKMEVFLLGILDMLFQASRLEAAYYEMNNFTTLKKEREEEWVKRIDEVRRKYYQFSADVMHKYRTQSKEDIQKYASENTKLSYEQFRNGLFSLLETKFYWRKWFVLVYKPVRSHENKVSVCDGHKLLGQNGRSIVVASKDQTAGKMNKNNALRELQKFVVRSHPMSPVSQVYYGNTPLRPNYPNAASYYDAADKSGSCSFAAVLRSGNPIYKASDNRVVHHKISYYELIMFG